jgi:hypothetical protein
MATNIKEQLRQQVLGAVESLENPETDVVEFLDDDCLGIETLKFSVYGDWKGAEVSYALGGPNVFIDTENQTVNGRWGGDRVEISYTDNIGFDDVLEEIYGHRFE